MDCFRSAGRRREALKIPQGILRELVKLSCASLGIDCSGCPRKHLLYKGFFGLSPHGVLGVECSNHSVPTILFNDLAQSVKVGLFHV